MRRVGLLAAACVAMMFSGCNVFGECPPRLYELTFSTAFDGALTASNRSTAREAFGFMGFTSGEGGIGGFFARNDSVTIFIRNGTSAETSVTGFEYAQPVEVEGSDTSHEARAMGYRLAPQYWPAFNETLDRFEGLTGWKSNGGQTMEPGIVVC